MAEQALSERPAAVRPEVLVVDDHAGFGEMLRVVLRHHGLTVHLAGEAGQAVEAFRARLGRIGVVLMDVHMPGTDGPATLALLREIDPSVRCCFMTGATDGYTSASLLELGAWHVFPKPLPPPARLARLLREVIEAAEQPARVMHQHAPQGAD